MALFKINKGLNANLPTPRHDGYAYFTTDDGKFWIDFESPNGVQQQDGTKVDRKALNAERADYVGYSLHLLYDGDEIEDSFNGLSAVYWDLTPAKINAFDIVKGSTVTGPAVFNNTLTVNNDAYMDSATIGDLLVNGGTRFVGDVNASKITASAFVGPLTGNASTADKVNHSLEIRLYNTVQGSFDGSADVEVNVTPASINAVNKDGDTMSGALTVGNITIGGANNTTAGKTISSNDTLYLNRKASTSLIFQLGGTEHARFDTSGNFIPASGSKTSIGTSARPWKNIYATTFNGNATSANKVNHQLKFALRSTDLFSYDGTAATGDYADADGNTIFDIVPNDLGLFDTQLGSTVSGEAIFNNVVHLNDKTYVDSLIAENATVNGALNVVGNLTGSNISATTFTGSLTGNATSADKVNHSLNVLFDSTSAFDYDGSALVGTYADSEGNSILDITPQAINAVDIDGTSTMTGTLKIDDVDGIKINSHNKDLKVWEIVGNAGSWNSQFGFYDLYKGTGNGNDNTLELYADNQSGDHVKVRTIKQDGTVNWHTVNTFDETIVGNIDTADKVNHTLKVLFDSSNVLDYDGSAIVGDYADEDGNTLLDITPEGINAVRRNGDTIPGPLTINGVTTVNNDMYIDSATVGDLLVNGGSRFIGDMNAGNVTADSFTGPLTGNATSADKINHDLKIQFNGTEQCSFNGSELPAASGGDSEGNTVIDITPFNIEAAPAVNGVYYGVCDTAKDTKQKTVTLTNGTGFQLVEGAIVMVKFVNGAAQASVADPMTLNVNSTGAKPLYCYGTTAMSNGINTSGWRPNSVVQFVYDGTAWYRIYWNNTEYMLAAAFCSTSSSVAAKTTTNEGLFKLGVNSLIPISMYYDNTYQGPITLNLQGTGAKPVYINGAPSSTTNYTLPAGKYIIFYDGTNYYFNTNGVISGNGHTHRAIVGSTTNNTSSQYYSFAVVTARDGEMPANTTKRYRAYYNVTGIYPTNNSATGTFTIDFSITSDANQVATIAHQSLRWTEHQFMSPGTLYPAISSDSKTLSYFTWSNNSHYVYEMTLLRVIKNTNNSSQVTPTSDEVVIKEPGYTIVFLQDNSTPVSSLPGSYYTYSDNGKIGTATVADTLHSGATLPTSGLSTGYIYIQTGQTLTNIPMPSGGDIGMIPIKATQVSGKAGWARPNQWTNAISKAYVTGCTSEFSRQYFHPNIYLNLGTQVLMGAAWNDYAEFRQADSLEPGRCVVENGDDTLSLSTERMQPGAEIISDTYGFAIGETENCKTPIAATGRVLAYTYEPREEFKPGRPVCSGPNGTVSLMTDEEAREYPWCIIGTVSAVPNYETWGQKEVQVNKRVWIRIK